MKSLIIEGCDGSGKDTLISELLTKFLPGHRLHERASTSLGGPVSNLADWVMRDAANMTGAFPWIYNRHPLISEPIYAPIRRVNPGLRDDWTSPEWIAEWRRIVGRKTVLVICQPPYAKVVDTIIRQGPDAHMPGVYGNIRRIYMAYNRLVWPGTTIRYDYTVDKPEHLARTLNQIIMEK